MFMLTTVRFVKFLLIDIQRQLIIKILLYQYIGADIYACR
jgi:hypothetical protein